MSLFRRLGAFLSDTGHDVSVYLPRVSGLIHVGANRAQERHAYAAHGLRVLWIEALPEAFADLERNIANHPDQKALRALVTDQDGVEHTFHVSSNEGQSSSLFSFADHVKIWEDIEMLTAIRLKGIRLDSLLRRERIDPKPYQALVLDTQGSELLVLRGAGEVLDGLEFIQAEAADFNAYEGACQLRDLDEFLRGKGFTRVLKVPMAGRAEVGHYYDALYARRGAWLWRLRLLVAKVRRRLSSSAQNSRVVAGLCETTGFVRRVGGLVRDVVRAALRRAPSDWSGWACGPGQLRRPRLWLSARATPSLLKNIPIQLAPFDHDHLTIYQEVFQEKVYDLDLVPFVPDVVFDCGAHIGCFSCLSAVRFPDRPIFAFEPDSANRWFLCRNTRALPAQVVVSSAAVSDRGGSARFVEAGHWGHLLAPGEIARTREVELVSLPDLLRKHAAGKSLLLKLDIEGAEVDLLPLIAPLLPAATAVFFETHGGTEVWHRCRSVLEAHGFAVQLLRRRDHLGTTDAFIDAFALRTPPSL